MVGKAKKKVALIGECMLELQGQAFGSMQHSYGGDTLNTAVYLARCGAAAGLQVACATGLGEGSHSYARAQHRGSAMSRWWPLALCAALLLPARVNAQQNRATYDSAGWAADTRGGRGGRIIRVTNLNADGPGSYREAIEAEGPRIVAFEVGGVIDMGGKDLVIKHPYITIAGQTAPHPGITLIKAETNIPTHDVIIQHLMVRPGEFGRQKKGGGDQDGFPPPARPTTSSSITAASPGPPTRTCRPPAHASMARRPRTGGATPRTRSPTATT